MNAVCIERQWALRIEAKKPHLHILRAYDRLTSANEVLHIHVLDL